MAGVKRQQSNTSQKWQNSLNRRPISSGKKPLPEPTTIQHVFAMLIMHICRKIVLFQPEIKVTIYLAALTFGSLVCDFVPIPKSYFSRTSNIFNQYFVKWGWGWTLLTVGIYLGLTTWIYCCGNVSRIRQHFYRLLIATVLWFSWTKLFVLIEIYTGNCLSEKYSTEISCVKNGSKWSGFDISGHAFILIYCSLLIAEEAKSIRGWERIGELIRNEEYDDESPLKPLSSVERKHLQDHYDVFTPYVRLAFILLTILAVLWDVMLVCTILYFHIMIQKVIGGVIAILTWFFTYRWMYSFPSSPGLPGQGLFKYSDVLATRSRKASVIGMFQQIS